MDDVLGLLGIVLFCACVIALAAAVTWLVVKLSPAKKAKPAGAARSRQPSSLDRRERQDVVERRVVEVVRLGDGLVRDLAVDDVHAERERRIPRDRLAQAVVRDRLDVRAASRSSTPSSP